MNVSYGGIAHSIAKNDSFVDRAASHVYLKVDPARSVEPPGGI